MLEDGGRLQSVLAPIANANQHAILGIQRYQTAQCLGDGLGHTAGWNIWRIGLLSTGFVDVYGVGGVGFVSITVYLGWGARATSLNSPYKKNSNTTRRILRPGHESGRV
jgi:hypothetical protein